MESFIKGFYRVYQNDSHKTWPGRLWGKEEVYSKDEAVASAKLLNEMHKTIDEFYVIKYTIEKI